MSDQTRTTGSYGAGALTPSDSADLQKLDGRYPRALRVNGAGDVAVMAPDGTTGVWTCSGPETLPIQAKRVLQTGTTVTASILPLY